jgi:hypothetical protein
MCVTRRIVLSFLSFADAPPKLECGPNRTPTRR